MLMVSVKIWPNPTLPLTTDVICEWPPARLARLGGKMLIRRKAANGMGQQAASVHKLEVTNGKWRDCVHSCVLEPFLTRLVGEDS